MYTFPLLVELVLQPIIVLLILVEAVAGLKPETKPAQRLVRGLIGCIGVGAIVFALIRFYQSLNTINVWRITQDFLNPLALSFLFLPCLYLLVIIMVYERLFTSLKINMEDRQLRLYTRLRMFRTFGVDHRQLSTITPQQMWEISRAQCRGEVDSSLADTA